MGPCAAVEGAATAKVFEAFYVEQVLAPRLSLGQVVVLDNLSAHKGERVRELVEAARLCAAVLAGLLAGLLAHRGGLLEAQGAAAADASEDPRGACGGDEPSTRRGDGARRRTWLVLPLWLPSRSVTIKPL